MKPEWRSCLKIGTTVFLLYLAIHYWENAAAFLGMLLGAATPLLIGCVIAYIVNIVMRIYERHYFPKSEKAIARTSRRPVCMVAAMISLVVVVGLIVWLIVPQLYSCVELLLSLIPDAMRSVIAWAEKYQIVPENILDALAGIDWRSRLSQIINTVLAGVGNVMDFAINMVMSVFSGIVTALMSIIFAIYLLTGKEKLGNQCNRLMQRYLKDSWNRKLQNLLKTLNECFHKYIVGQCTEALILGGLCLAGMLILQLPYAPMISALIAFTALIPVAGGYIGAGIGAFMILTVSPVKALIFLIFIVVLQQLEGNIIYPKVVGSSMGLPAIWVLAAVTIGGGIMGIIGMVISVPIAATAYRLLQKDLNRSSEIDLANTSGE